MKKLFVPFLLIGCVSLVSCEKAKSKTAIFSMITSQEELLEVDAKTVEFMINNKYNFNLLMYTQSCSYCEKALESAQLEQNRYNLAIYALEMNQASIAYLTENLPSLFSKDDIYPAMYLFADGKISYKIDYNNLTSQKSLHRVLYPELRLSTLVTFTGEQGFMYALNENTTALVYTYDSSSKNDIGSLTKKVIETGLRSDVYYTVFFDKFAVKSPLISDFYQYTGFTEDSAFDYLFIVEDGQIKTTVRYLSADGNQIDSFLNSIL